LGDLESLERFAEKSALNLIEALEKSKQTTFEKLLFGLGIRHLGEEGIGLLKKEIENSQTKLGEKYQKMGFEIEKPTDLIRFFDQISEENLFEISGFGARIGESLKAWFENKDNQRVLEKLEKRGVEMEKVKSKKNDKPKKLAGKTFVITGILENYSRDDVKNMIKAEGGKVSSSVSKNTDFIIAGKKPGSKYEKGVELNIRVLGEEEFKEMI
jgi:DNA ligase (NAD+)